MLVLKCPPYYLLRTNKHVKVNDFELFIILKSVTKFQILTKDSVTVIVDAVVYFHVKTPMICFLHVQSYA